MLTENYCKLRCKKDHYKMRSFFPRFFGMPSIILSDVQIFLSPLVWRRSTTSHREKHAETNTGNKDVVNSSFRLRLQIMYHLWLCTIVFQVIIFSTDKNHATSCVSFYFVEREPQETNRIPNLTIGWRSRRL